jgi:hypothetical protein
MYTVQCTSTYKPQKSLYESENDRTFGPVYPTLWNQAKNMYPPEKADVVAVSAEAAGAVEVAALDRLSTDFWHDVTLTT